MSQKFLAVTQSLHQVCEFSQDDLWPGALHSLTTPPLVTETEEEEERKKERWRTVERNETPQFSCSRQNGALFLRKLRHVSTNMKVTGGFADCFQKNFLLFSFFSFFFFIKRHRVLLASRPLPSLFKTVIFYEGENHCGKSTQSAILKSSFWALLGAAFTIVVMVWVKECERGEGGHKMKPENTDPRTTRTEGAGSLNKKSNLSNRPLLKICEVTVVPAKPQSDSILNHSSCETDWTNIQYMYLYVHSRPMPVLDLQFRVFSTFGLYSPHHTHYYAVIRIELLFIVSLLKYKYE